MRFIGMMRTGRRSVILWAIAMCGGCGVTGSGVAVVNERLDVPVSGNADPDGRTGSLRSIPLVLVDPPAGTPGVSGPFFIGQYEITNREYWWFISSTGYDGHDYPSSKPSEPFLALWKNGVYPKGQADHPACGVNVHHAKAFCEWLSKVTGRTVRLPTDAEWSLAARGPSGHLYPWGNEWEPGRANIGGTSPGDPFAESAPVGSFPLGVTPGFADSSGRLCAAGIHDLAGNIWEWTQEGHLRGGPWCMGPKTVRSDSIDREDTERADDKFGLRIVVELPA